MKAKDQNNKKTKEIKSRKEEKYQTSETNRKQKVE